MDSQDDMIAKRDRLFEHLKQIGLPRMVGLTQNGLLILTPVGYGSGLPIEFEDVRVTVREL